MRRCYVGALWALPRRARAQPDSPPSPSGLRQASPSQLRALATCGPDPRPQAPAGRWTGSVPPATAAAGAVHGGSGGEPRAVRRQRATCIAAPQLPISAAVTCSWNSMRDVAALALWKACGGGGSRSGTWTGERASGRRVPRSPAAHLPHALGPALCLLCRHAAAGLGQHALHALQRGGEHGLGGAGRAAQGLLARVPVAKERGLHRAQVFGLAGWTAVLDTKNSGEPPSKNFALAPCS